MRATCDILVVEDDLSCRELVTELLQDAGFSVVATERGEDALLEATRHSFSLVIIDVHLPSLSGYSVFQELRRLFGTLLPIMFISGERTERYDRIGGFVMGVDEYLVKPFDREEFVACVRKLVSRVVGPVNGATQLTKREWQVLSMLSNGHGQRAIADQLAISPRTVATHIQRILTKLGVHSRAAAVAYVTSERRPVRSEPPGG